MVLLVEQWFSNTVQEPHATSKHPLCSF